MKVEEFKEILDKGETDTVEFKSWIKAKNQKEIISLAVDELIAFITRRIIFCIRVYGVESKFRQ